MTRILIRAPHSPFVSSKHEQAILGNEINSNAGNLLFPYSVTRAIMTPGVEVDFVRTCPRIDEERTAQFYNEKYDCFVIPLANAFRSTFVDELERLAGFIEAVDIPCIVVGVGLQAGVTANGRRQYRFDDSVLRFVKAVLEKSDCIGVRGETTGSYLAKLGFTPDRDFMVIGCPSMYQYGAELPRPRPLELTPKSSISVNCKVTLPEEIHRFMRRTTQLVPDFHYVVQNTYEMISLYYGLDVRETNPKGDCLVLPEGYPTGRDNPTIRAGRVIGFVDVPSWITYLQGKELCFGTRIHGNIAGVLAGAPTFITAPDARVLELARFHEIPHIRLRDLDESKDIFHLIDGVDFDTVLHGHNERFQRYLEFLHRNGLQTMFDEAYADVDFPFDKLVSKVKPSGPIHMKRFFTVFDKLKLRAQDEVVRRIK